MIISGDILLNLCQQRSEVHTFKVNIVNSSIYCDECQTESRRQTVILCKQSLFINLPFDPCSIQMLWQEFSRKKGKRLR